MQEIWHEGAQLGNEIQSGNVMWAFLIKNNSTHKWEIKCICCIPGIKPEHELGVFDISIFIKGDSVK